MSGLFGNDEVWTPYSEKELKAFKLKTIKQVKEYLQDNDNYHTIDDALIAVYASSICDIRTFSAYVDKQGALIQGIKGRLTPNPALQLKQKAFDNATKLADKLGIMALNRKKMQGKTAGDDEDDFAEFEND